MIKPLLAISLVFSSWALPAKAETDQSAYGRAIALYRQGKVAEAETALVAIARTGDVNAQRDLGWLWEQGQIVINPNLAQYYPGTRRGSNRQEAVAWYLPASKAGDTNSMAHMGRVLVSLGHVKGGLTWLNYSARWGNSLARQYLSEMGAAIPAPDLAQASIQRDNDKNAQGLALGLAVACVFVGRCGAANPGSSTSTVIINNSTKSPKCTLNPVFKDIYGRPKVDCR